MDVTQPLYGQTNAAAAAKQTAQDTADSALSSDFETFLQMLTVQMQNQDPLNPIDSADYAVQLATFSGVEQQVKTNELLGQIAGGGAASLGGLASLVGSEVRTTAPTSFDGAPIEVFLPRAAETGDMLAVVDANGAVAQRIPLQAGLADVSWAGVDPAGRPMPSQSYTFHLEPGPEAGGETMAAETYATVREVLIDGDAQRFVLAGGAQIGAGDVTGVRQAR